MKKNRKMVWGKRLLSYIIAVVITVTLMPIELFCIKAEAANKLSDPRITKESSMDSGQKVTWDCVWFGSYPQSEVTKRDAEYSMLQSASGWDQNGDIIINDKKYRRILQGDATYVQNGVDYFYNWSDTTTYHYFKYEPIKWRVLKVNGNQAFLLSDMVLDDQQYHITGEEVTWETCTIRSWLNGYNGSKNEQSVDYSNKKNFIDSAFSTAEQSDIIYTTVMNKNNIYSGNNSGGGNNTVDKIFLLSESEVYNTNDAKAYGFLRDSSIDDEARRSHCSTYAKAMGTWYSPKSVYNGKYAGSCYWWLRSPGSHGYEAAAVAYYGCLENYMDGSSGSVVYDDTKGIRPALNLELSSGFWSYAGTVSSDEVTSVKVSQITISGISKQIAAGKKITLKPTISPANASDKAVTWKSSNTKVATVNSSGVVTMKNGSGGKKVTITATAKDGSGVKATYTITSMKGVVKKIAVSGAKSVTAGKSLTLKAKVTASKGANTKLKWSSSNKKYATVSSSGKIKALKAGKGKTVKITAAATDGSGKKKIVTLKIK